MTDLRLPVEAEWIGAGWRVSDIGRQNTVFRADLLDAYAGLAESQRRCYPAAPRYPHWPARIAQERKRWEFVALSESAGAPPSSVLAVGEARGERECQCCGYSAWKDEICTKCGCLPRDTSTEAGRAHDRDEWNRLAMANLAEANRTWSPAR